MRLKITILLLCLILPIFPLYAGTPPKIETRQDLVEDDYFRHPTLSRSYSESWFYLLSFDNGPILFLNFLYTNLGIVQGMTGVEVVVTDQDTQPVYFKEEGKISDYIESRPDKEISFTTGKISGHPAESHRVRVNMNGFGLDVAFSDVVPGFKIGDGKTPLGKNPEDFVYTAITIPRARVEGNLTINGTERSVSGWAYGEHSYQTVTSYRYSRRWHTLRMYSKDYSLIMLDVEPTRHFASNRLRFLALTDKNDILLTSTDFALEANHAKPDEEGRPVPTRFDLSLLQPGFDLVGSAINEDRLDRYVMADHLSKSGSFAVKTFVGNPVFYRSTSECSFKLTVDGVERDITGEAVSEVIVLD